MHEMPQCVNGAFSLHVLLLLLFHYMYTFVYTLASSKHPYNEFPKLVFGEVSCYLIVTNTESAWLCISGTCTHLVQPSIHGATGAPSG